MISSLGIYRVAAALIPALLQALVGALLLGVFTLRLGEGMALQVTAFFAALAAVAAFRVVRDIWFIWPYAYHTRRFALTDQDRRNLPRIAVRFSRSPLAPALAVALAAAAGFGALGHWGYAADVPLLVVGVLALPLCLSVLSFALGLRFFVDYLEADARPPLPQSVRGHLWRCYLLPELLGFVLLNLAILSPLYNDMRTPTGGVGSAALLLTVLSVSSAMLLAAAREVPQMQLTGAVFSRRLHLTDAQTLPMPEGGRGCAWQVRLFPYGRWLLTVVGAQCLCAWLLWRAWPAHWFDVYVPAAELIWCATYFRLRGDLLRRALAAVVHFYREHPQYYSDSQLQDSTFLPRELTA